MTLFLRLWSLRIFSVCAMCMYIPVYEWHRNMWISDYKQGCHSWPRPAVAHHCRLGHLSQIFLEILCVSFFRLTRETLEIQTIIPGLPGSWRFEQRTLSLHKRNFIYWTFSVKISYKIFLFVCLFVSWLSSRTQMSSAVEIYSFNCHQNRIL